MAIKLSFKKYINNNFQEVVNMTKSYDKKFKTKVALEALKEELTLAEISSKYGVPSHRISVWKREAKTFLIAAFEGLSSDL
jgi:transposase